MRPPLPADFVRVSEALATRDRETLARWWADLNGWGWPDDFPWEAPPIADPAARDSEIMAVFRLVDALVPRSLALRAWDQRHRDRKGRERRRGS
jgi:hypothetical protein